MAGSVLSASPSDVNFEGSERLKEIMAKHDQDLDDDEDEMMESGIDSDSEALSDIFDTDSETDNLEKVERPLYLDEFEKFPPQRTKETADFEDHLRQISADSRNTKISDKDVGSPELDEVDRMILQAASLLKKQRK